MDYQRIIDVSDDLISVASEHAFVRAELFAALNPPKQNVVILKGARGIGKSTLLLQFLLKQRTAGRRVLYVSADSALLPVSLAEFAHEYYKRGGEFLAIDEIHKYEGWQQQVKTIIDSFANLKLLVSGSSSIQLDYTASDLSRRHVMLTAQGLSLREYLNKNFQFNFAIYPLQDLLLKADEISAHIATICRKNNIDLLSAFKLYLRDGYFLSRENYNKQVLYYNSLLNTINSVIDADLPSVFTGIDNLSRQKIKILLKHIALKCPFTPNIAQLSRNLGIASDNTLKKYLYYLDQGEIITNLYVANKSHKDFQKPQKILLNNTNFSYAHDQAPLIGTIRETFAANCLYHQGQLTAPAYGDFCLNNEWTFEIGGKSKDKRQLGSVKQSFVLADDIVSIDHGNLPLWLLGFLW